MEMNTFKNLDEKNCPLVAEMLKTFKSQKNLKKLWVALQFGAYYVLVCY